MELVSKPNNKTRSYSFDISAIVSCPGKSKLCSKHCYARQLEKQYPNVNKKYKRNFVASKKSNFVNRILPEIYPGIDFRIHVSGDFYSIPYIHKWIEIANKRKSTQFYVYSRSWRSPRLWPWLRELGNLPNVCLNLSYDDETGEPLDPSFRWAYMATNDDSKRIVRPTDIVFRTGKLKHKIVHKIGGCRVCPLERGIKIPLTCATCRICVEK